MVSALSALPETLKTSNKDMPGLLSGLLAHDRELKLADPGIDEGEARLVAHVVLGERRLLDRHLDRVPIERGLIRVAILEIGRGVQAIAERHVGGPRHRK